MSIFDFVASVLDGVFGTGTSRAVRPWTNDDINIPPDAFSDLPAGVQQAAARPPRPMYEQAKDQVVALQKIDPDFSDVAFLQQATKTYQAALTAGSTNAAALGNAATQAFRGQLAQRIGQLQSAGLVRTVSGAAVDSPMLFKISVDGTQQLITVRFTGTVTRYTADAASGMVTDGSKQPQSFVEFAVFTRPAGTTTPKSVAAGAPSHCSGCGAPVEPGLAVCPYCHTPLTGTGSLWQIDRISASPYT